MVIKRNNNSRLTGKPNVYIGIDPGVQTGVAVWNSKEGHFQTLRTLKIHQVMELIAEAKRINEDGLFIRFEDARKRKWFGNSGREKLQGAGSVKRDCTLWEDFLIDLAVDYECVEPKRNKTKLSAEQFKQMTGWSKRSSVHSRDAAMLVFGM